MSDWPLLELREAHDLDCEFVMVPTEILEAYIEMAEEYNLHKYGAEFTWVCNKHTTAHPLFKGKCVVDRG